MRELPGLDAQDEAAIEELATYYLHFAQVEAAGVSPRYAEWAHGVAQDRAMLSRLAQLPPAKRQANLLFAAARLHGVDAVTWSEAAALIGARWSQIEATIRGRATQTNEPGRIATLNLAFAQIQAQEKAPLALIEVGASAGLCLYPDAWPVRYRGEAAAEVLLSPAEGELCSTVELSCELHGLPAPQALPLVGHRAGIDLNPLDVTLEEDLRWLQMLIWPGMEHRIPRISAGAALVAADPPALHTGDLNDRLAEVLAQVPDSMTPVVFHTAVLAYLSRSDRLRFRRQVEAAGARWVSNEGLRVVEGIAEQLPGETEAESGFVLSLDGEPLARTAPHGQSARSLRR
ncbi:DUF2332 domain-containing protein [Nesterenkonia sp. E16_7]|uniref:DUF2332 domain-containing protein n=1 Tax=unclassified Nesterenkonia TaxID=2629769 RepID=UPI001A91D8ED|nr:MULTISPECIES: DUF2332 domain-containing protein [unclassified Nesterenkonia]MBO0594258.1 DUF2332 domain-containing protein [Nesterenkonia sp. E16_10]MBO0597704.1 DUF2332 domain-containing protein [Nesterenkonia sp. E16_7]